MDKFLDSTEVLPILRVLECGFSNKISQFGKFRSKLFIFDKGQDNLLDGQFWAIGKLNY